MKLSPTTFNRIRQLVHEACGLALGDDKAYLVEHRLEGLARARGLKSFEALCDAMARKSKAAWDDALVEALTTRETFFFRDVHPFEAVRRQLFGSGTVRRESPLPVRRERSGVSPGEGVPLAGPSSSSPMTIGVPGPASALL